MLRHSVAFGLLAAALTLLPEPSVAGPAGFRGGIGGPARIGGFRPNPQFRGGTIHGPRLVSPRPGVSPHAGPMRPVFKPVTIPPAATGAFTTSRTVRLYHHRHHRHHKGWAFATDGYASFIGIPYDPGEAIPVYAPQTFIQQVDAGAVADEAARRSLPVLTRARGAGQDACSSEKVTVPAREGEREITVVRC